jgi:glycine cleavage system transcriptional repressor
VPHLAVAAVGADRPGIVAAVTRVLLEHGCNLEDTSMTILRGQFAMMLVVDAPAGLEAEALESALAQPASELNLVVVVRPLEETAGTTPVGDEWTVTVYGSDHPGIVHGVAALLADEGVNIVDLTTRLIGEVANPVYAMFLDVTVPAQVDAAVLGHRLQALAAQLGVECSFHRSEVDIL